MEPALYINLAAVVLVCLMNPILWFVNFRQSAFVTEAAQKDLKFTVYFYKHTFLFWSLAWFVWLLLYVYFIGAQCFNLPSLSEPAISIFISDLNSVLFFGVYFAYLRGKDYRKLDLFVTGAFILVMLTVLQLALHSIESKYPFLPPMAFMNGTDQKVQLMILYFTPSLMFSLISYFMIGFAFYRRLRVNGIFLTAACLLYASFQVPIQISHYNGFETEWPSAKFAYAALGFMKLVVAGLFLVCFSLTNDTKNLLGMTPRWKPKGEKAKVPVAAILARRRSVNLRISVASVVGVAVYLLSMFLKLNAWVQLLGYFLMLAYYLWVLYDHFNEQAQKDFQNSPDK